MKAMVDLLSEKSDTFLVSSKPRPISFLDYQFVFYIKEGNKYLKSFNILYREQIIKKYYLDKLILIDANTDLQKIIKDQLTSEMTSTKHNETNSSKARNTNRPKPNAEARAKSASSLFSQMGF